MTPALLEAALVFLGCLLACLLVVGVLGGVALTVGGTA